MFSTMIDKDTIQEVREFLLSDNCEFVDNMNRAGLSFGAMALILEGINSELSEVEKKLNKED